MVALDLSEDRRRAALLMGEDGAGALDWVATDITDFSALKAVAERYDAKAIIHLAGLQVPFCAASPALGARVNVEGTINILQLAREMGIKRTAYASSIASLALPPGGRIKKHSMAPTSWRMSIARLSIGLTGRCLLSGCVQMLCMGWGGIRG